MLFTKVDVHWGYNNIRIKPGDKWKAAFLTPEGLFEPTIMFFGVTFLALHDYLLPFFPSPFCHLTSTIPQSPDCHIT